MQEEGLPPLLFTEIEGDIPHKTICFYGHFDKYPAAEGWTANKCSTKAGVEDQKLYGQGSASGSSTYTSALAIRTLQEQKIPLPSSFELIQG